MNNTPLNDYQNLMDSLDLPDRVRTSVMRKATQPTRTRAAAAPRPVRTPPRRRMRWGLAAGACAAVALCAIVAVGLNTLPVHQALNYQPLVNTDDTNAPAPAGNFFALAAYAAENPEREPGKTVAVDLGDFGLLGGWSAGTYDRETDTSYEGEGRWLISCGFSLDLTCTGENVESLAYQLQGDAMHFLIEKRYSSIEEMQDDAALGPIQEYTNDFEIAFADQAADKDAMRRTITTQFPVEGELLAVYDAYYEVAHDPNATLEQVRASSAALDAAVVEHYVALLAQSPLILTATFADGTTQTKTYLIEPVENYQELRAAFTDALIHNQDLLAENPNATIEEPPHPRLFTLTELTTS